jgi:deazaflavin-dependent oxidoreductase (nitroreductase family)
VTINDSDDVFDSPTDWVAEHVRSYLETGGEDGHLYMGFPALLLTTRGRKSGKLRRTPLIYGRDGDRYLLVASNAASSRHPAWYLNVVAHPEVTVQVKADTFTAEARTATGDEKRLFWPRMAAIFPQYDVYQSQTDREIPVVILTPVPPTA